MDDTIEMLDEKGRWRARDVIYWSGTWEKLSKLIPDFKTDYFRAVDGAPSNPYMKTVIRLPMKKFEQPIPVGVVSNSYTLAQHSVVAHKCFEGIQKAGINTDYLNCDLGLTELGEWMNLRIYFPDSFSHTPSDGEKIALRLECFNSVDGSSRLIIFLGWLRFICSNGLVIGETKVELRDIHNNYMDLAKIPRLIFDGLKKVNADREQLFMWEESLVDFDKLRAWADKKLSESWGKKAACRVFHICRSGSDVEIIDPFSPGTATEKPIKETNQIPGAPKPARNLLDVSQALSWVATGRKNPEERLEWQAGIPNLIEPLINTP